MAIYYKFKSARDYDTIAMDGPFISVGILKDKIFETKHLGSGKDLDIVVSNAQTNEEYLDESMLIPKNTSVLIRRVPGRPRITVITTQEPRMENKVEHVQPDISNIPVVNPPASNYPEEEWDEFGNDLYSIPDAQNTQQQNIPRPDLTPVDEKVDEESKIQALIDTPALDWQRQGPESFGAGRGYNRGMNGRMGGRGFGNGMERKTPPPGYICHRCNVPGHFIQHCPTNGDPNYDVKRVKPPTGIPKSMLMATPDGSYSLPSGAVAVLKPNEDAFEKEMEGLPSTTRSVGELPPELKCPLCKEVMRDAALTSKCCFQSFCDKCIRDHIITKSKCVCGATDVLADDLLPNKTLRDTINRILEAGNDSTENAGSVGHIPDLESARCPPPKALSPTTSVASKGEKKPAQSNNNDASTVKPPMEVAEITSAPRASGEVKVEKPVDACESTQGPVAVKEATTSKVNMQPPKEEVPQQQPAVAEPGKKKKKKARVPGTDMQWNHVPDLAGPDYMMQMGPGPQYFNGMQPGFNGVQPGFNGVQPGFNGFHPGFNGFGGPFPGAMPPPFMNYGMNPMDMGFPGGMNMMHPDPFAQGFGFPNIPPPHRDLAELGNRMNMQRAMLSREEVEARKAEMLRKRENDRRNEGGKMIREGENSRMMMNNGASASASSINPPNKSRQGPPPSNSDYDRRRRPERLSPEHLPLRKIHSPPRDSKRKSERYPEERDRQRDHHHREKSSRHQELDHHNREHDRRSRDRREEDRSSRDNHHRHQHRDSERSQHHTRKRSEPPSSEPVPAALGAGATKAEIDNHKSSVFARISFPEEEPSSKRRKVSSSSSTELPPAAAVNAVGTSVHHHRHSRKEVEVAAEYESSDEEDRHFKRKPSRYERSPPVVVNDVTDDKLRYSKRGKGERSRA